MAKSKSSKRNKSMKQEIQAIKKQMNRQKPEFKRFHFTLNTQSPLNTGSAVSIVGITGGTDIFNRIGDKIRIRKVDLSWRAERNAAGLATQVVRVMVVKDFGRVQGAVPGYGDIMFTNQPETTLDLSNYNRFRIIYDKSVVLSSTGNPNSQVFTKTLFPKFEQIYEGPLSTSQSQRDLLFVCCSNQTVANPPSITGDVMVHYYDA